MRKIAERLLIDCDYFEKCLNQAVGQDRWFEIQRRPPDVNITILEDRDFGKKITYNPLHSTFSVFVFEQEKCRLRYIAHIVDAWNCL